MKTWLCMFTTLLFSISLRAEIASTTLSVGAKYITFSEEHQYQSSLDSDFNQTSTNVEFDTLVYFIPHWAYFGINASYTDLHISKSSTKSAKFLDYSGYAGIEIPAEPVNIRIHSEYYSDSMTPSANTFGYKKMDGTRFSAIFEALSKSGGIQFLIKYPFWNSVKNRSDFMTDLIFHYGELGESGVANLIDGFFVKFSYKYTGLEIPGDTLVTIKKQEMGMNIGFNW
jgi:hypothetical protein